MLHRACFLFCKNVKKWRQNATFRGEVESESGKSGIQFEERRLPLPKRAEKLPPYLIFLAGVLMMLWCLIL